MKTRFLALLALVLGMASCQQDFTAADSQSRGEVSVQLSVAAPELLGATRAESQANLDSAFGAIDYLDGSVAGDYRQDWSDADLRYSLEVYDVADLTTPIKDRMVVIKDKYEPAHFELRLIPNRNYQFVVFADFVPEGTAAQVVDYNNQANLGLRHTIGANLTDIAIKQAGVDAINDEFADAYFKTFAYEPKDNNHNYVNESEPIILKRPYGKLRVVATDLAELNLNVDPYRVKVTYSNDVVVPTSFNAVTGAISGEKLNADKTFESVYYGLEDREVRGGHYYNIGYDDDTATAANGTVRASHLTLFTDYILGVDDEHRPVSFQMTVFDQTGAPIKTVDFNTNIPIQRNHLTTIVGNVLTTNNVVDVTIDDNFANADNKEDKPFYQVAVTTPFEFLEAFYAGQEIIITGDMVVTEADVKAYWATRAAVAINPVINLNGYTITFINNSDVALLTIGEGSSLTIVDTVGTGAIVLDGDGDAIENNGGTVNIDGATLASEDGGSVILNNGTLNNNGGVIADDAVENGDNAVVGTRVYTAEELQAAINNAASAEFANGISFGANIAGDVTVLQNEGINLVINGYGYKFDGVFTVNGNARAKGAETLTFKNINFETEGDDITFISAPSKVNNRYNYSHNVTVEDCTFKGNHTVGAASFTGTYNFVMKNCDAVNMHSLLQVQSVDNTVLVDGVTVKGSKNGLAFGNTAYPTLKNSVIEAEAYGVRADGNASRGKLVIENTTIDANVPVVVRKVTTDGYNVALNGNTINGGRYDVVFTKGADDEKYVAPTTKWSISGADNYIVYPRECAVYNAEQLAEALADDENVKLFSDINLANVDWTPVGTSEKPFKGSFDGNGKKISNLTVGGDYAALVAYAGENVSFKNLYLENVNVDSSKYGAALVCVAENNVTVNNVTVSGNVYAKSYAAGLVVMNNDDNDAVNFTNCVNNATVSSSRAGGIAAWVTGGSKFDDVVNNGNITGTISAAGITNRLAGSVNNAVNNGVIKGEGTEPSAGIVCITTGKTTFEYCYNIGNVTTTNDNANASAAGILGHTPSSAATFNYCANFGDITAEQSYAAGICYSLYGNTKSNYCYNAGAVNGADGAGAIAPKAQYGANDTANYCLNAGVITSKNGNVYQGSIKNNSSYYYDGNELRAVANNAVVAVADALAALNGGADANFFVVEDGVITVK